MKKVYLKGVNVVLTAVSTVPIFIPVRSARFQPTIDQVVITDHESGVHYRIDLEDLIGDQDQGFATIELASDYLSEFIGSFKTGGGVGNGGAIVVGSVLTFPDLPDPSLFSGQYYAVQEGSGGLNIPLVGRFGGNDPGLYISDGTVWMLNRDLDATDIIVDPTGLDFTTRSRLDEVLLDIRSNYFSLITNNTGQIKLNWTALNRPESTPSFLVNTPKQIALNENYTVSGFPITTYPYLADESILGRNVISELSLCLRELKPGQIIIFRVKAGYINKGAGQNGSFNIRMYNPNPASTFEIIKSIPTPDGTTTYQEEFEFIAIADDLSLDPLFGYKFEAQSSFNDVNLVAFISNITAFYLATESFNK